MTGNSLRNWKKDDKVQEICFLILPLRLDNDDSGNHNVEEDNNNDYSEIKNYSIKMKINRIILLLIIA